MVTIVLRLREIGLYLYIYCIERYNLVANSLFFLNRYSFIQS